jgi:hypothetical protein
VGRHADGEPRAAWTAPGRRLPWRRAGAGAASLVVTLAFTSFAAVGSAGAAAATVATCATLSTGAHGAAVATIQRLVGTPADGDFGPLTAAALARWQTTHHLRGTGRVDAATWRALPTTVATQACGQPVRGSRGVGASCPTLHTAACCSVATPPSSRLVGKPEDRRRQRRDHDVA